MKDVVSFALKKTSRLLMVIVMVSVFSFTLISLSPIDPVTAYLGYDRMQVGKEQEALIVSRWGLDKPSYIRFIIWAKNIISGDLGESVIFNEPVSLVIQKRFISSFLLMAVAWVVSGAIGLVLGILAGTFRNSFIDTLIRFYAYIMASTPTFWVAMTLLVFFSVIFPLFPVCCKGPLGVPPDAVSFRTTLYHLFLPSLALSIIGIAQIAMHTREKIIDVFMSDYALYAMSMGETKFGIIMRHGLRMGILPAMTLQFASMGELFGGAVLTEQVFSFPGLGNATVLAGLRGDVPLLLGIAIFSTVCVVGGNTLADIVMVAVDPRIRDFL